MEEVMDKAIQILNFIKVLIISSGEIVIPLGAIGTLFSAIFACYKYYKEKNKELYIERINQVYGPLYLFLCTQEATREIFANFSDEFKNDYSLEKAPIFELSTEKTFNGEITINSLFKPDEFLNIISKSETALMSTNLMNLIGVYKVINYLYDDKDESKKEYFITKLIQVERKIIKDVIDNYTICVNKIGLNKTNNIIKLNDYKIEKL